MTNLIEDLFPDQFPITGGDLHMNIFSQEHLIHQAFGEELNNTEIFDTSLETFEEYLQKEEVDSNAAILNQIYFPYSEIDPAEREYYILTRPYEWQEFKYF